MVDRVDSCVSDAVIDATFVDIVLCDRCYRRAVIEYSSDDTNIIVDSS